MTTEILVPSTNKLTRPLCLCAYLILFLFYNTVSGTEVIKTITDKKVDGWPGNDTVEVITENTSFKIKITSSGGSHENETYIKNGSVKAGNVYIENLDQRNGDEIIVFYTDQHGDRRLFIINRSRDRHTTQKEPEQWTFHDRIISQDLKTDYDHSKPISLSNLIVTNLAGFTGKELVGVAESNNLNYIFVIKYGDNSSPDGINTYYYRPNGSVEEEFIITQLDTLAGKEIVGFYTTSGKRNLYIINNARESTGDDRNYGSFTQFSMFGQGIFSSHIISISEITPPFTTNNVGIFNLDQANGKEIVGLYSHSENSLGLFRINYCDSAYYVTHTTKLPGNSVYKGVYNRPDDARYTIGNLGTNGANGAEVYGYYGDPDELEGGFIYWDNFSSQDLFTSLQNPDENGTFTDTFHSKSVSSGKTVGDYIFSLIDEDNDNHHDGNDLCPTHNGYVDGDEDGTCTPTDACDSNPEITTEGACGCDTTNADRDPWLACEDECDNDPFKKEPGICGCGHAEGDSDFDGVADCNDQCPSDPEKTLEGFCGCFIEEPTSDQNADHKIDAGDCAPDACPNDPNKFVTGICGCGVPDEDSDNDGSFDCDDECPYDTAKSVRGECGCFNADTDSDNNGIADCLEQSSTETTVFYHTDPTGTPIAMTDSEGEPIWQATYLPFGEEYSVTGLLENNRRFIGKEKDVETGLSYFGARYMDVKSGRFLAADPVRIVDVKSGKINAKIQTNPQRFNLYTYGLNNPYRYVDPDGEFPVIAAALIGAAIAYSSAPDIANAPESSSTPTFESHGERSIVAGAAGGAGLKKLATLMSTANKLSDDSGPVTTLYHGGKLNKPNKSGLSTTTDSAHAAQYAKQHGGKVHKFEIPTRRLYKLESQQRVSRRLDSKVGTNSAAKEWRFSGNATKHLKKVKKK